MCTSDAAVGDSGFVMGSLLGVDVSSGNTSSFSSSQWTGLGAGDTLKGFIGADGGSATYTQREREREPDGPAAAFECVPDKWDDQAVLDDGTWIYIGKGIECVSGVQLRMWIGKIRLDWIWTIKLLDWNRWNGSIIDIVDVTFVVMVICAKRRALR